MSMTKREYQGRNQLYFNLKRHGFGTYAKLFSLCEFNFTKDPNVIGYTVNGHDDIPHKIVLNEKLNAEQASVVVRHEIMHNYLKHMARILKHLNKDAFDGSPEDATLFELSNIAADFEISNRTYGDEEKRIIRILHALVTEDHHKDWINLTMEEMFDKLKEERDKDKEKFEKEFPPMGGNGNGNGNGDGDGGGPRIGDKGDSTIQEAEEIERIAQQIIDGMPDFDDYLDDEDGENTDKNGNVIRVPKSKKSDNQDNNDDSKDKNGSSGEDGDDTDKDDDSKNGGGSKGKKDKDKKDKKNSNGDADGDEEDGDDDSSSDMSANDKRKLNKIKDSAKNLKNDAKDLVNDMNANGRVLPNASDEKKRKQLEARLEKIANAFKEFGKELEKEDQKNIEKQRAVKASNLQNKYFDNPLVQFRASISDFIKTDIGKGAEKTYRKYNKNSPRGVIKKGTRKTSDIPTLNIYFDHSPSWTLDMIEEGRQALSNLSVYEAKGLLKTRTKYFADNLYSEPEKVPSGEYTRAGDKIIQDIIKTHAKNVLIMTDGGLYGFETSTVTVPGTVWFIFKKGITNELYNHVHGKHKTQTFDLTNIVDPLATQSNLLTDDDMEDEQFFNEGYNGMKLHFNEDLDNLKNVKDVNMDATMMDAKVTSEQRQKKINSMMPNVDETTLLGGKQRPPKVAKFETKKSSRKLTEDEDLDLQRARRCLATKNWQTLTHQQIAGELCGEVFKQSYDEASPRIENICDYVADEYLSNYYDDDEMTESFKDDVRVGMYVTKQVAKNIFDWIMSHPEKFVHALEELDVSLDKLKQILKNGKDKYKPYDNEDEDEYEDDEDFD